MVGMAEPMFTPQIRKDAKYRGMRPCMAKAWRIPTAAEEDWITAQRTAPTRIPSMGFLAFIMKSWNQMTSFRGFIAPLMVCRPWKRRPKPRMIWPICLVCFFLE